MTGRCEARVFVKGRGSHGCPLAGKVSRVAGGVRLRLCRWHLQMLERSKAPEALLERWAS